MDFFVIHNIVYYSVSVIVINEVWKGNADRKSSGTEKQEGRGDQPRLKRGWAGGRHDLAFLTSCTKKKHLSLFISNEQWYFSRGDQISCQDDAFP